MKHLLDLKHWDFDHSQDHQVSLEIDTSERHLNIAATSDPVSDKTPDDALYRRMIGIEVRDNGALAILCYPRDGDEPIVVTLDVEGGAMVHSDIPVPIMPGQSVRWADD